MTGPETRGGYVRTPKLDAARESVIAAVLHVVAARYYDENHPEDPHGGDNLDLHEDVLNDALNAFAAAWQVPGLADDHQTDDSTS